MNNVKKSSLLCIDEEFDDQSHHDLMDWCEEILERFFDSHTCSSWKENKKNIARFFIHGFVNYAYGYHLAKPFQYDEAIVEDMCLDILPRKMSTNAKDFKLVAPVLIAFFDWCEKEGVLADTKAIREKLKVIDSEIYEKAKNPSNWGLAKSLFAGF
jgi:hypothetical protein